MDCLTSEDLKEVKLMTASTPTITRQKRIYSFQIERRSFWYDPNFGTARCESFMTS